MLNLCHCLRTSTSFLLYLLQATSYMFLPKTIPDNIAMQELHITLGHGHTKTSHPVMVTYGIHDRIINEYEEKSGVQSTSTFCNHPWENLFQRTGIQSSDLWLPGAVSVWVILCFCKIYVHDCFIINLLACRSNVRFEVFLCN